MSIVKDLSLSPSGLQKIQWVRDFMPALGGIEERFRREKPFEGLTIAVSVHLEAKTANLGLVLREGGAQVYLTGCNPLSTQDDVAAAMADLGVETFGVHGVDMQGDEDLLVETLKCRPHLIVDDGGDLISLMGGKCAQYGDRLLGGCEETTTGIHRLYARERAGILPCPMMAVNDAKAKHYYDNKYGTGQSTWDAIMHTTNLMVAGKTVVVAGYAKGNLNVVERVLLFVAAINLSCLTQSRLRQRVAEIGVRRAFGSTRLELMGQIIAENLVVTLMAGVLGLLFSVAFAYLGNTLLFAQEFSQTLSPPAVDTSILLHASTFGWALLFCFILNLLSSGIPAWRASRVGIVNALGGRLH